MTRDSLAILASALLLTCQALPAPAMAQVAPAPAPATAAPSLLDRAINGVLVSSLRVSGPSQTHTVIDSDVQGGKALKVVVPTAGANSWDAAVASRSTKPVAEGAKLVIGAWLRADPSMTGPGRVVIRLAQGAAPYTRVAARRLELGPEWKLYFTTGVAPAAYEAGQLSAGVQMASQAQTIEVGPIFILAMEPDFDLSTIPED